MPQHLPTPSVVYDGGDLACGELLLELHQVMAKLHDGDVLLLVSNDPAAPLDLRAWCNLVNHTLLGETLVDGRAAYSIRKGTATLTNGDR